MSVLKLIRNTVNDQSAFIDTFPVSQADLSAVTDGGLYLRYSSSSNPLEINYVDKNADLSANVFVGTNFNTLSGEEFNIHYYTDYSSSQTDLFTTISFSGTVYNDSYYLLEFDTVSGAEGFGITISGAGTKVLGKLFFGESCDISYCNEKVTVKPAPDRHSFIVLENGDVYSYDQIYTISFNALSNAEIDQLDKIDLTKKPFFLYDPTGNHLLNNLEYFITNIVPVVSEFDDLYHVDLTLYRVKE